MKKWFDALRPSTSSGLGLSERKRVEGLRLLTIGLIMVLLAVPAFAAIKSEVVEYKQGETILEGSVTYDTAFKGKRPGVIVVHDWMGVSDYTKMRAQMLARLGFVAFVVDIYGKGVRPQNADEAGKQASLYKSDRLLMRARVQAGLDAFKQNSKVDPQQIAAIGYCFGGTVVLEMARAGMDVKGVASFHGGLSTPTPAEARGIQSKVLVLHGADDPYVPLDEVKAFQNEMNDAHADWQMIYYSGAVHSFTRSDAGSDNSKGAAYNKQADERSWEAMQQFFNEIFGRVK